jgi:hypothetical protein
MGGLQGSDRAPSSTPDTSQSLVVQPLVDDSQWDDQFAPLNFSPSGSRASSTHNSSQTISPDSAIQQSAISSLPTSSVTLGNPIQPAGENSSQSAPVTLVSPEVNNSSQEEDFGNIELLAREVYSLLKQRIEIERERRGTNYSGRLP